MDSINEFVLTLEEPKRRFVEKVLEEAPRVTNDQLLPFLLAVTDSAKKKNIHFTQDEINAFLSFYQKNATPEERSQIALLQTLLFNK